MTVTAGSTLILQPDAGLHVNGNLNLDNGSLETSGSNPPLTITGCLYQNSSNLVLNIPMGTEVLGQSFPVVTGLDPLCSETFAKVEIKGVDMTCLEAQQTMCVMNLRWVRVQIFFSDSD